MKNLLDYSWARPGGKAIKKAGYDGVLRYLSLNPEKNISLAELKDLHKNGLGVGLVWEQTAQAPLKGFSQGVSDATKAFAQARAVGFPDTLPIYFACDWDTTPGQQSSIDAYLKGCASVIEYSRVGVYGSYYVIERCFKSKTANWFWQTLAWSGRQISKHNHIYQNGKTPKISATDENEAVDNWGGWYPTLQAPKSVATPEIVPEPQVDVSVAPTPSSEATDATTTLNPSPQTGSYTAEPQIVWKGTGWAVDNTKPAPSFLSVLWSYIQNLWK